MILAKNLDSKVESRSGYFLILLARFEVQLPTVAAAENSFS